jgi:hypothetical protein
MHTPRTRSLLFTLANLVLFAGASAWCYAAYESDSPEGFAPVVAMAAVPVFGRRDASLNLTKALPNGAAATASDGIDTQASANAHQLADLEFVVNAPALGATPLPDAKTMIYSVEMDHDSAFGSATVLIPELMRQTGAGGGGAAAKEARFRLPSNAERYIRVKATGSASGDASASSFTVKPAF